MKVLRHALGPAAAPVLVGATRVLTVRWTRFAALAALFLAGRGQPRAGCKPSPKLSGRFCRWARFARSNEESAGCGEASALGFLDCCCWGVPCVSVWVRVCVSDVVTTRRARFREDVEPLAAAAGPSWSSAISGFIWWLAASEARSCLPPTVPPSCRMRFLVGRPKSK